MKTMSTILLSALCAMTLALAADDTTPPSYKPKDGFVPDAKTAIKIAVAVWEPIYGEQHVASEKPYRAHLTNGIWTVEGSLPEGSLGGVALAEIAKEDGRIVRVIHGK